MKSFDLTPMFSCKSLWDFNRKCKCDKILDDQRMTFQVLDAKEQHFLELLDDDLNLIEPLYTKGGLQLKFFGHSNLFYTRALKVIVNHALIEEYHLRFFPKEDFKCLYSFYPVELRKHILYIYTRYNNYQNLRRNTISYFMLFLEFNGSAFSFREDITYYILAFTQLSFFKYLVYSFSFFLFFSFFHFHFPYHLLLPVYSYKVTTVVCLYALHNKLLN